MLRLRFDVDGPGFHKVLCLGSHPDDIEIGCGGTILRLIEQHSDLEFRWVVFASRERTAEGRAGADCFLKDSDRKEVVMHNFRDGFFPYVGGEIKEEFVKLETEFDPDVIFTHYRGDLHQDHRLISELTRNSFRDHLILEYEIPKYDGDLGAPNMFVPLSSEICDRKVKAIVSTFQSQQGRHWFTEDTFRSLMRIRGVEARSPTRFAEAFYCHKFEL